MTSTTLSQTQLNFARFSIVSIDINKLPLKDILTIFIEPADLDKAIQNCDPLVKGKYKLNPDQINKCYYNSSPDYSTFDITLLYKLIRNLCPSLEPTQKWGNEPDSKYVKVGDDIERIRCLRNSELVAHSASAEISDDTFKNRWSYVKCIIQRCQQYTSSKGCTTDYNKMLQDLERKTFTFDEYTFWKGRSGAICVFGKPEIFCGKTARFEAEITLEDDVFLPVSWDRVDGMLSKQLDVTDEKYRGSDNRRLLIHNVCKDDEAGYQAVLSRNYDVKILSNKVYLRPKGDLPCLENLNATSKEGKIYIHYVFKVSENSPIKDIRWTKNNSELQVPGDKYRGGEKADSCFTILMAGEDDMGLYTCTVWNAVGSVSKNIKLGIPSADIVSTSNSKVICGSDTTFDCTVSGYPSPDVVKWQLSPDGKLFIDLDTDTDKYLRSRSDICSHSLLVRKATLKQQGYYQVVVSNSIGKCTSNKLFLQVTGSKPNLSEVTCSFNGNSVKLKCDVFLYDESPPLNYVYWTKGDKYTVIATNDEKYSGADINDPSLTIYNVNYDDAGKYQLIAVNPVGETRSTIILLGVPEVRLKECIKKEDGSFQLTMTIKSVPVPHSVKWTIKEKNTDTFEPINVSAAEYIGTSNTFPHPVLVIKQLEKLDNCVFEIEVKNRIGEKKLEISGKHIKEEILMREKETLGTFYAEGGFHISFSIWLSELAEKFPKEKNKQLKFLIQTACKIKDVTELEKAKDAQDCFNILLKENILSPSDVMPMQFLLKGTNCEELEKECIEYAKQQKAMHFYEKPPENGYRNVRFHVVRYLQQFSKEDETKIRETISRIVGCNIEDVRVNGYLYSSSFFIVLSIKEIYIERLFDMKQHDKEQLSTLSINYFKDDFKTMQLEHTAVKDKDNVMVDPTKSTTKSSKEYCYGDNGEDKLKQAERIVVLEKTKVPLHVKGIWNTQISEWKDEDKMFLETHNFTAMLKQVRDQPYVTFVGAPGSGKTATARHIAIILQREGYQCLPINKLSKIEEYCDPEKLQVFVIDDVVGVWGFDLGSFSTLTKYKETLINPSMPKTKVLMTCREVVYRNKQASNSFLTKEENVVLLQSTENALNENDKRELLSRYQLGKYICKVELGSTSPMFPLLCKLFSTKDTFNGYGPSFFTSPVPCILEALDIMKVTNNVHYASLVLLMAWQSPLSIDSLKDSKSSDFEEKKCKFLKACKVSSLTENFVFVDALSEMKGTYTVENDKQINFIHDSMFKIIAYHFGRHFPEVILENLNNDYIANYIQIDTSNSRKRKRDSEEETDQTVADNDSVTEQKSVIDLCIKLKESQCPMLAKHWYSAALARDLSAAFGNVSLKHPYVFQPFIRMIEDHPYGMLHYIFFESLGNDNFVYITVFGSLLKNLKPNHAHALLTGSMRINKGVLFGVKGISFVIYYGHHQILQCIIDRVIREKGNLDDLFENEYTAGFEMDDNDEDCEDPDSNTNVTDKDCDTDSNLETTFYLKQVSMEQIRLVCLGCHSGDLTTVQILLRHVDINALNITDNTYKENNPLAIAIKLGHLKIAMELLKIKADVDSNIFEYSPLIGACKYGHISIVEELIKNETDVNLKCKSLKGGCITPLIMACQRGQLRVVEELIKSGADVNLAGKETPLTAACLNGNLDIVEILLAAKADINLGNEEKKTPLEIARERGHLDVINRLTEVH